MDVLWLPPDKIYLLKMVPIPSQTLIIINKWQKSIEKIVFNCLFFHYPVSWVYYNSSASELNLKHKNHGATDCKITNKKYIEEMKMRVISSPPYEDMPTFDWSTVKHFKVSHIGLPDKWEFPWVDISFKWFHL